MKRPIVKSFPEEPPKKEDAPKKVMKRPVVKSLPQDAPKKDDTPKKVMKRPIVKSFPKEEKKEEKKDDTQFIPLYKRSDLPKWLNDMTTPYGRNKRIGIYAYPTEGLDSDDRLDMVIWNTLMKKDYTIGQEQYGDKIAVDENIDIGFYLDKMNERFKNKSDEEIKKYHRLSLLSFLKYLYDNKDFLRKDTILYLQKYGLANGDIRNNEFPMERLLNGDLFKK